MWAVMFVILFVFAVVMLLFGVIYESRNDYWNLIGVAISSFTFLILSLSQLEIQFPYTAIQTNNTIISGVTTYTDPISPYLVYYFFGLFVLTQLYIWSSIWDIYNKKG